MEKSLNFQQIRSRNHQEAQIIFRYEIVVIGWRSNSNSNSNFALSDLFIEPSHMKIISFIEEIRLKPVNSQVERGPRGFNISVLERDRTKIKK
jgi:hypothetical protein